ncbi:ATP-dependent DNA helicase [Pelagibaculum spongiae]|uniref:Exonuclease V subunit alpha n=1 Tax=Pelagibaculum spongiae TaxID=2080658 RepID=A0A2V1GQA2_9GAMM|nr:AAA family ATPase [Pelagibaculum spongiae]PVZ65652.1 exonuclease V subunit alpha [Pelagibaculum spongiae]
MNISNFDFLKPDQPTLAELGFSAEQYAYSDPQSAIVKLRNFAEQYVGFIYRELTLPVDEVSNLFERINHDAFKAAVEPDIVDKLHLIRMRGNKAAHHGGVSINDALVVTKEAYLLAAWLYLTFYQGEAEQIPAYHPPEPVTPLDQQLKQDKQRLQQNLTQQSADLENAKAELEAAQNQQKAAQQQLADMRLEVDQIKVEAVQQASRTAVSNFDFQPEETRKHICMADVYGEYQLTDGQAELVKELDHFLTNKEHSVFLLKGYAGTGKTFITKGLTEYFRAIGRNYVLAAPTGKAAKVISAKTGCEAYTIHKTIYSMKDIVEYSDDGLSGSETFKFYAELAVNERSVDTVYIIDEASMISDIYNEHEFFRFGSGFLLGDFLKYVNLDHNDHRKKVIFIGDNAQLPPVGMNQSPALDASHLGKQYNLTPASYELTEVVRQKADSGVMKNASKLRTSLQNSRFNEIDIDVTAANITRLEHQELVPAYMQSCGGRVSNKSVVIAASNADVAAYNKAIREVLFPGQSAIVTGDKIMAVNNNNSYGFTITNGSFGQVIQLLGGTETRTITIKRRNQETTEVEQIVVPLNFRKVVVRFWDMEGEVRVFEAHVFENLLYSNAPTLSSDENKALYLDFCMRHPQLKRGSKEFRDALKSDPYFTALRLKFGYAITCHKAQGSEWEHVFIKCRTHHKQLSADYFRWLYTAMTRTSSQLYLLEPPRIKLGSGIKVVGNPGTTGIQAPAPTAATAVQAAPIEVSSAPSSSVLSSSVPPPASTANASLENFGLHSGSGFLLSIYDEVTRCIDGSGIAVHNIDHNQYQEAYVFCLGADTARINIAYNGKQKISSIQPVQVGAFSSWLLEKLALLKGRVFSDPVAPVQAENVSFGEAFLDEFHQRFAKALSVQGVSILQATPQQYSLRYHLGRDNDVVNLLIYYNSKQVFTKCNPIYNQCSSPDLTNEVISVFQEGLL